MSEVWDLFSTVLNAGKYNGFGRMIAVYLDRLLLNSNGGIYWDRSLQPSDEKNPGKWQILRIKD
jgi:hypothetical protein